MRAALIALTAAAIATGGCNRASAATPATASVDARNDAVPASDGAVATEGSSATSPGEWREVTVPAGTRLPIVLETTVGSDISRVEQPVQARISRAVIVRGQTVIPQGSGISGVVTDATRSGRVKGRAHVAVRFDTLEPRGSAERYPIRTAPVGRVAQATKGKDAVEILAPAAGGAIVGRLLGGRKGALIGAAAGGGAGTAVVLSTRGKEIHLPRGARLLLKLEQPVRVRVPA